MKYFLDTEFHEYKKNPLIGKPIDTIELISIGIVSEDYKYAESVNGSNPYKPKDVYKAKEYYAVSKDFDLKAAWNSYQIEERTPYEKYNGFSGRKVYWLRENVLIPIFKELAEEDGIFAHGEEEYFTYRICKRLLNKYGKSNKQIAEEVLYFCSNGYFDKTEFELNKAKDYELYNDFKPEFYAYYADYDWVVFCWLFGRMIDLPKGFPMYCIDLKQMLDEKANSMSTMEITDAVYGKGYMKHDVYKYADEKYPEFNVTKVRSLLRAADYAHSELKQTNEHNALADAKWNKKLYEFLNQLNK